MKRILFLAALFAALPLHAQFGGLDIGKALDIGRKAMQQQNASKEFSQEDEIGLGDALTASFLGASPLHSTPTCSAT